MAASETVQVGVGPLAADDVVAVARHGVRVEVTADALATVAATRERYLEAYRRLTGHELAVPER